MTEHRIQERLRNGSFACSAKVACEAADHIDQLEYKIDELMLEYCPDEMTKEQMENWAKHQVPAEDDIPK